MNVKQKLTITIEHIVITSSKSYEQITKLLEEKMMYAIDDTDKLIEQLVRMKTPWQEASQVIQNQFGKSSFQIFRKIDHGLLLSLAGKPRKAVQYTIGNPLLAVQMTQLVTAVALYAPFKVAVYEDDNNGSVIIYDELASFVSQFHNEELIQLAKHVDSSLEALVASIV